MLTEFCGQCLACKWPCSTLHGPQHYQHKNNMLACVGHGHAGCKHARQGLGCGAPCKAVGRLHLSLGGAMAQPLLACTRCHAILPPNKHTTHHPLPCVAHTCKAAWAWALACKSVRLCVNINIIACIMGLGWASMAACMPTCMWPPAQPAGWVAHD